MRLSIWDFGPGGCLHSSGLFVYTSFNFGRSSILGCALTKVCLSLHHQITIKNSVMKKSTISNAAIGRIVTAQRAEGFGKWRLNFNAAQAKREGLTEKQVSDAHQAFCDYHGTVGKTEMVEVVYAAITQ